MTGMIPLDAENKDIAANPHSWVRLAQFLVLEAIDQEIVIVDWTTHLPWPVCVRAEPCRNTE